jgi:hypothetical protein
LTLSNPTGGAVLGAASARLYIVDNDSNTGAAGKLQLVSQSFSVVEGATAATISVKRTDGTSGPVSVQYTTGPGTATPNMDYLFQTGMLNWADGDGSVKTFTIPILDDQVVEGPETVGVKLREATGGATLGSISSGVLTITDNDVPTNTGGNIKMLVPAVRVGEGDGTVSITIVRTGGSDGTVTIDYGTRGELAAPGGDYAGMEGRITFAPGETSKTITVPIFDDQEVEGDETFRVVLNNPTGGATLSENTRSILITIGDNDSPAGANLALGTPLAAAVDQLFGAGF